MCLGGSRYFVSFIDDYKRHTWIYLIEKKSEVFDYFRNLKKEEYFFGQFNVYLQQTEIRHEFSCRYMPKQNGIAEMKNRSVVEAARAMMKENNMPKFYWAEVSYEP